MRRSFAGGVGLACLTGLLWAGPLKAQTAQAAERQLTILYTVDLGGRFRPLSCGQPDPAYDFAQLVATLDREREQTRAAGRSQALVFNGGDNIGPHAFARFLLARPARGGPAISAWLKRAGYHVIALGDEDFRAVPERLRAYLRAGGQAGLFFTAANVDCVQARQGPCAFLGTPSARYRLLERDGITIAVLSVVAQRLARDLPPDLLAEVTLRDPIERARQVVAQARRNGADLVVILSHLDDAETSPRGALALARAVPDVDLILANAMALPLVPRKIDSIRFADDTTPIVGGGLLGRQVARVDLRVEADGPRWRVASLQSKLLDVTKAPPAPSVRASLASAHHAYCQEWDRPLGQSQLAAPMDAKAFGSYLLEILRQATGAELAFIPRDLVDVHSVFPLSGALTAHDVFSALTQRNRIYTFDLTAKELIGLCGRSSSSLLSRGLTCGGPIVINGRKLNPAERYSVATIESLARPGGKDFPDQQERMRLYRGPDGQAPVLGQVVRGFLSGPAFVGPDPQAIDPTLNFPDLARKLRWSLSATANLNLADTRIENGPDYQESQLTRDEFIALKGELRAQAEASSKLHTLRAETWLKYARSAINQADFVESEDLSTANLLYMLKALRDLDSGWYVPALFLEAKAETELTRPALRSYHHLELTGLTGARFSFLPTLQAKIGLGVRDQILAEKNDPVFGIEVGYELMRTDLSSLLDSPFLLESRCSAFFGDLGRSNTLKGQWLNRLHFALVGNLYINVSYELFFYRFSTWNYGWASDLTFGLSYHVRTAWQTF